MTNLEDLKRKLKHYEGIVGLGRPTLSRSPLCDTLEAARLAIIDLEEEVKRLKEEDHEQRS